MNAAVESVAQERKRVIRDMIGKVRRIEETKGVTREALAEIKECLIALTQRKDLFGYEDFPAPTAERPNILYKLWEEEGNRFALYISTGLAGKATPPHDHKTWACIAGMSGAEHNRIYRRTDDGSVAGHGTVEEADSITLTDGVGVAFLPDDIHSIHALGDEPTRHFHLYGQAIEVQKERIGFNVDEGTYKVFAASPHITIPDCMR